MPEYNYGKGNRCKATSRTGKNTGKRCGRPATPGHLVCSLHGARSPQAIARVARDKAEAEIKATILKLGYQPVANPLEALRLLAGEIIAFKDVLRNKVNALEDQLRYKSEVDAEQIRGEVILYERALDRAAHVLGLIAKLNIDDRLAAIEEAKVTLIVDAVEAGLDALGLPVEQQLAAKAEISGRLRRVV